jgi:hypothetical protein
LDRKRGEEAEMRKWVVGVVVLAVASTGIAIGYFLNPTGVPPVKGYVEGKEIYFIHTETSDPKVAELLTEMMGSPVLVVPALAKTSDMMVANVYVFTNGIFGEGPFQFQADVFDNPPGTEGYTPLRAINLVKWKNEGSARKLTSAAEVKSASDRGEITIERPGVVVNMPLLTWPGGRR